MKVTPLALALLALGAIVHQTEGLMIKKYNSKHGEGGMVFIAMVSFFSMLFFVITDRGGFDFSSELLPYGIISGVIFAATSYLTCVALGCGSFVLTNLFLSYSLLIPTFYGLFILDESATVLIYVGLAMMAVSIFLTQKKDGTNQEKCGERTSLLWIASVAFSVVGSGLFGVMQKLQQVKFNQSYDSEFMIITLGVSSMLLLVMGMIKDKRVAFSALRRGGAYALIAGASNGATNLLNLTVNAMLPISIAAPSRSGVTIVTSFLISLIIFKEKLSARQILGVIIGMAALVALNLKI